MGIFPWNQPSSYWGTPMTMEPHGAKSPRRELRHPGCPSAHAMGQKIGYPKLWWMILIRKLCLTGKMIRIPYLLRDLTTIFRDKHIISSLRFSDTYGAKEGWRNNARAFTGGDWSTGFLGRLFSGSPGVFKKWGESPVVTMGIKTNSWSDDCDALGYALDVGNFHALEWAAWIDTARRLFGPGKTSQITIIYNDICWLNLNIDDFD